MKHICKLVSAVLIFGAMCFAQQLPGPFDSQTLTNGGAQLIFNNPYPSAAVLQVEFQWSPGTGGSNPHISIMGCNGPTQCDSIATVTSTGAVDNIYPFTTTIYSTFKVAGSWTGGNANIAVNFTAANSDPQTAATWSKLAFPSPANDLIFPANETVSLQSFDGTFKWLISPPSSPGFTSTIYQLLAEDFAGANGTSEIRNATSNGCGPFTMAGNIVVMAANGQLLYCAGFDGTKPRTYATNLAWDAEMTTALCASSSGSCGADTGGHVSIAAAATTVTVSTTAVTANSVITLSEDSSVGSLMSVTCNTTAGRTYMVTARTPGTSFVITSSAAPTTNPACLGYRILN